MHLFKNISSISLLVALNITIARVIENTPFAVINQSPSWLFFGILGIITLVSILVLAYIILKPNPIITQLILVGIISNIIEYYSFGFVVDYLNFGIGILNLADIQIYIGLIWLTALSLSSKLQSDSI